MTISTALSIADVAKLSGPHTVRRRLSVVSSTVVATALVNMPGGITFPVAVLTVDTTSGWSSVVPGQRVTISDPVTGVALAIGRVRKLGNSTTLYVNEQSAGDFGLLASGVVNRAIQDNDAITITTNKDMWGVLPRIVIVGGGYSIYDDFDQGATLDNSVGAPINNIAINGQDGHYDVEIANGATIGIALAVVCDLWPTISSITAYQWIIPSAWGSETAGDPATDTVTYDVPVGEYEIGLQTTDDNGNISTSYRQVWVHDDPVTGTFPAIPITTQNDIRNRTGRQATVHLSGKYLSQIPLGAMVQLTETVSWNGSDIASATRKFTGWVIHQDENSAAGLRDATIDIVGPMDVLKNLGGYSDSFTAISTAPVNPTELQTPCNYADFLVWLMLRLRARGVLELFNYYRLGVATSQGVFSNWTIPGANIAAQLQQIATYYRANIGARSDGAIVFRFHPSRQHLSDRTLIPVRMAVAPSARNKVTTPRDLKPKCRSITGEGFQSDGLTTAPRKSIAYGNAPGQATQDDTLNGLIVDSQDDNDWITGQAIQQANNPYPSIPIHFEGNFDLFEPAEMGYISLPIAAASRPTDTPWGEFIDIETALASAISSTSATTIAVDHAVFNWWILRIDDEQLLVTVSGSTATVIRGYSGTTAATHADSAKVWRMQMTILDTVSKTYNGDGTVDMDLTVEAETIGVPGVAQPIPSANSNLYSNTTVITPAAPISSGLAARDLYGVVANLGAISDDGNIYRTANFTNSSPTWTQTSLGVTGAPVAAVSDPFSPRYLTGTAGGEVDAYVATDTTGIYSVKNCQGSPAATLQKTFRGTTSLRSLDIQFGSRYTIVCRSVYSDGVYVTYSTDGTTWSAETLDGDATTASYMSGVFVSTHSVGRVYGSSLVSGVGKGRGSVNSGATFATLSSPDIETGTDLAGHIHAPYASNPSDLIAYHGASLNTGGSFTLSHTFDFRTGQHGWDSDTSAVNGGSYSNTGIWTSGHGWLSVAISGSSDDLVGLRLINDVTTLMSISSIVVTVEIVTPPGGGGTTVLPYTKRSGAWALEYVSGFSTPSVGVYSGSFGSITGSNIQNVIMLLGYSPAVGGQFYIQQITLNGTGSYVGASERKLMMVNGASISDVSPIVSSTKYGPWQSRQIDSCPINRNYMGVAAGNNDQSLAGLWTSNTAGAVWTQLAAPSSAADRYERIAASGNTPNVYYVFGKQGSIGVSTDGATVQGKTGNISTFSPGSIINIMGL